MEPESEPIGVNYGLIRLAFGLLSAALVIASVERILMLPVAFGGRPLLPWLMHTPAWRWSDVPVTLASLVGGYLLWGRFEDRGWQRRTGLLLLMFLADSVLCLLDHADDLGLRTAAGAPEYEWFRFNLGRALGWAELALLAGLACDVLVHLDLTQAAETGKATRSLAGTGATVWMMLFLLRTSWRHWPLQPRMRLSIEMILLNLGSTLIWTITLLQVTALAIAAARQAAEVLAELVREESGHDLFAKPADDELGLFPNA